MLYREIIAVCSEIYTTHINTLCGDREGVVKVKRVDHRVALGGRRVIKNYIHSARTAQ
jgi:hypothetical protein